MRWRNCHSLIVILLSLINFAFEYSNIEFQPQPKTIYYFYLFEQKKTKNTHTQNTEYKTYANTVMIAVIGTVRYKLII